VNETVMTRQGVVQGSLSDGVYVFKGIPYAAAPFGAQRFLPPAAVEPWSGVRAAFEYGLKPPQVPYPPPLDALFPEMVASGEDCLNLNVWTAELGAVGRPVMVWIAGGEFEHVTNAEFDGSRFARDGVVCVSINYRVGADGFLCLGDGTANCGLLDQVAALEWVRDNIAAFGGDPANVTVFGESAGAISIAVLLSVPRVQGLFQHAICQSGAAHPTLPSAAAQRVGLRLAERLGVAATREAIAAVPIERFLQAQVALSTDLASNRDPQRWGAEVALSMMPWQPVIDGDVIPASPMDGIASGASANIDLLVGTNAEEWRLFLVPSGVVAQITDAVVTGVIAAYGLTIDATLAAYRTSLPSADAGDLLAAICGDWYFRVPAMRLADTHTMIATTASTYVYEFAWRSPQFNGTLGACHGLEIPFVFDTLGLGTAQLLGKSPPQFLADKMHAAWVAFASNGSCDWPKYNQNSRATMRFDTTSEVVENQRPLVRALWGG
jgi:para-nitrobenzyl esterase